MDRPIDSPVIGMHAECIKRNILPIINNTWKTFLPVIHTTLLKVPAFKVRTLEVKNRYRNIQADYISKKKSAIQCV